MKCRILLFFAAIPVFLFSQSVGQQRSIALSSAPEPGGGLRLTWKIPPGSHTGFSVRKKDCAQAAYSNVLATLQATDTTWVDATAPQGSCTDYVLQALGNSLNPSATIRAVLDYFPALPGGIALVLDTGLMAPQDARIQRWIVDLQKEGWSVFVLPTHAQASPTSVRQGLQALRLAHPHISQAALMGRVPVPYSGDIYPDGHTDHRGAWPADGYYGDLDGFWSDQSVNSVTASQTRNHNVPGDGKFDPSMLPSDLDLAVGRMDFSDMSSFGGHKELLERYLDKNHAFRSGDWNLPEIGIVDDNFPSFQEGFAAPAWRGFYPIFGLQGLQESDFFGTGNANGALIGYGCGGGSYQSCSGVGTSSQFASDSLKIPFNLLFGSYFGDWDNANAFLRAPLASRGMGLINMWAGRPYYYLHPLAAGATWGEMYKASVNVPSYSFGNAVGQRGVHTALMGDPSLVLFPRKESADVQAQLDCDSLRLSWPNVSIAWPEFVEFAWASDSLSPLQLISRQPFANGQWTTALPSDTGRLFSRLLFKRPTGSGYFYQFGPGDWFPVSTQRLGLSLDSLWAESASGACDAGIALSVFGGQAPYQVAWMQVPGGQTGTGNSGLCPGNYVFTVTDAGGCSRSSDTLLLPGFNTMETDQAESNGLYPNPSQGKVWIKGGFAGQPFVLMDAQGRECLRGVLGAEADLDLQGLAPGWYGLRVGDRVFKVLKK